MTTQLTRWDLFCKVVDNFGDIGVCWRLARQLAQTHGIAIRLWVDDLALAQRFAGAGHANIQLQHWTEQSDFSDIASVVIETFACGLPQACQTAMLSKQSQWLNLDYLSAEAWVDSVHTLPSPQSNGLIRYFFYPGFGPNTGGLIREARLPDWQTDATWQSLGIAEAPDKLNVSLFCYAYAPLSSLIDSLAQGPAVRVLVPEPLAAVLGQVLAVPTPKVGDCLYLQQAEFLILPFYSQDDYDRLLSLCDLNFVRGEDSWIRAIWSGRPMLWLPYLQSGETHLDKLKAFLAHYLQSAVPTVSAVLEAAMLAWAQGNWQSQHWQALVHALPQVAMHAQAYARTQAMQPDLATNLVIFIEKLQKNRV